MRAKVDGVTTGFPQQQDGLALEYESEDLRASIAIVTKAVQPVGCALGRRHQCGLQDGCALEYASEDLRANADIVSLVVQHKELWSVRFRTMTRVSQNTQVMEDALDMSLKQDDCKRDIGSEQLKTKPVNRGKIPLARIERRSLDLRDDQKGDNKILTLGGFVFKLKEDGRTRITPM